MSRETLTGRGWVGKKLSVAIPASLVSDTPHLREKTAKIGFVARACSIFGVTEIVLYLDDTQHDQREDVRLCSHILNYVETPQYLRKRLFPLNSSLRFTGVLPPLQTPHHNVPHSIRQSKPGDVRDGIVIARRGRMLMIDVGLERTLECPGELPTESRVTVRLKSLEEVPSCEIIESSKISIYRGYQVRQPRSKQLGSLLEEEKHDLKIGTSRYGTRLLDAWSNISSSLSKVESVLIAFGSPRTGLREILALEGKEPADVFDFFVNTVPDQYVSTVRTEEAVLITLALLNVMRFG